MWVSLGCRLFIHGAISPDLWCSFRLHIFSQFGFCWNRLIVKSQLSFFVFRAIHFPLSINLVASHRCGDELCYYHLTETFPISSMIFSLVEMSMLSTKFPPHTLFQYWELNISLWTWWTIVLPLSHAQVPHWGILGRLWTTVPHLQPSLHFYFKTESQSRDLGLPHLRSSWY